MRNSYGSAAGLLILLLSFSLHGYGSVMGDDIILKKKDFFTAVNDSDAIFAGKYLRGGSRKAKVAVTDVIVGGVSGKIVINGIDEQKYHRKYRKPKMKSGEKYIFFVKKAGGSYQLHKDSVTVPVIKNNVNFSFISPYFSNFWKIHDRELFKVAVLGLREKKDGMLSGSVRDSLKSLVQKYYEKKDFRSMEIALNIASILSVQLDEEMYGKLVTRNDTIGCLSVKYSTSIMGEMFFRENILNKLKEFAPEIQAAAAAACIDADLKEAVPKIGDMLKTSNSQTLAKSVCFPDVNNESSKAAAVRAVIEINAPESTDIIFRELQTADYDWLEAVLSTMSEYMGADLVELGLKGAVDETSSRKRMVYAEYFDRIRSPEVAKDFMKLYEKRTAPAWKKLVLSTLGKYGYKASLKFMIDKLKNAMQEEIRATAAMSLGKLNAPEAVEPLYKFIMGEKSILSKTIGIDAIAGIKDKSVQKYLKLIVKNAKKPKVREEAAEAIEDNLFILRYGRKK